MEPLTSSRNSITVPVDLAGDRRAHVLFPGRRGYGDAECHERDRAHPGRHAEDLPNRLEAGRACDPGAGETQCGRHQQHVLDGGAHREQEQVLLRGRADLLGVDKIRLGSRIAADQNQSGRRQQIGLLFGDRSVARISIAGLREKRGAQVVLERAVADHDELPRLAIGCRRRPARRFEDRVEGIGRDRRRRVAARGAAAAHDVEES